MLCGIAVLRHMVGVQPASALWEQGYFADRLEREYHHDKAWKIAGAILGGESGRLL